MTQAESPGVQGLPIECCNRAAQGGRRPRRKPAAPAVARVSYQGMVQMGHVNPYLVGAPRLQPTLDMAVVGKVLQHPVMGNGLSATLLQHGHALAIPGMATMGRGQGEIGRASWREGV